MFACFFPSFLRYNNHMKKAALIFILLLPFLASCDTDQKSLTYLTFGKLYDSSLSWKENMKEIDYIALNDYVTNQDSFILFVGDDKQTCAVTSLSLKPYLG